MSELWRRLQWFFRRRRFEAELEEELSHHAALAGDARKLGNTTLIKEDSRTMWTGRLTEQLFQDLRYGLRAMAKNRLFTAMAVVSLALGIGANTAIYSFMDAVLMRRLPVSHPEQLVVLNWSRRASTPVIHNINGSMWRDDARGSASPNFPFAAWEELGKQESVFESLFAYARADKLNMVSGGQAELAACLRVSGNFYSGLGVIPAAGRLISEEDDRPGAPLVVVLSFDYWRSRFAGHPEIVGSTVKLDNLPFTVIGVSAPGFAGIEGGRAAAISIPLHAGPLFAPKPENDARDRFLDTHFYWLEMMGRLRPGVTMAQAESALGGAFRRFVDASAETDRERKGEKPQLWLEEGASGLDTLRREYSKPLLVLMAMVGLILAIACANVANLMLARSSARRREIAVRLSLGANRARIVRQLLTESAMLSMAGGLLGLIVAFAGIRGISWLISDPWNDLVLSPSLNWPLLAFTFALSVLTGLVFGLAPALQSTRIDVTPALKEARASAPTSRGGRIGLGQALIVAQVAMSLVLAVAAGLFVRTLSRLNAVELGFNRENLLVFSLNARPAGYKQQALANFYENLLSRFRSMPGVRSASLSDFLLVSYHWNDENLTIPGYTAPGNGKPNSALLSTDAEFLKTMQIPILLGRSFDPHDMASPRVAIVSEVFAKKFFPCANPIGRRIGVGSRSAVDTEIVGVARDAHFNSLREELPAVLYVPYTRYLDDFGGVSFEIRAAGDPLARAATVRAIVHDASPAVPVDGLTTQGAVIDNTISQQRTFADLCSGFAVLALLIACVGLYGTMAYTVARRTGEIGIRIALGAKRTVIVWMVLRQVCLLAGAGLTIGLVIAWQSSHVVESFLYGVKPNDAWVMAGAALALTVAAIAAGFAPAWRASRIDPMAALRHE
jgi:predicted permease